MDLKRDSLLAAAAVAAVTAMAAPKPPDTPALARPAVFDRFTALAGEWEAVEDGPLARKGQIVARYAVTAGGSAVVEIVFPGAAHEMVTVYTTDGPDVVLTHYCVAGNQPRMRAASPAGDRVRFAYDGGPGIDPSRDRHMHSAWIEFAGPDEIRSEWTEHADGKPVFVAASHLRRRVK